MSLISIRNGITEPQLRDALRPLLRALVHLNARQSRMEILMSRLTESAAGVETFVNGVKAEVATLRADNDRLREENAAALADDAQDTAQIEELLAEREAVADRLDALLIDAGEADGQPETEPGDLEQPAEETLPEQGAS